MHRHEQLTGEKNGGGTKLPLDIFANES